MTNMFSHKIFRMSGVTTTAAVPILFPGSNDRPADIYHEQWDSDGLPTTRTAVDVTIRSAYTQHKPGSRVTAWAMSAASGEAAENERHADSCKAQQPLGYLLPALVRHDRRRRPGHTDSAQCVLSVLCGALRRIGHLAPSLAKPAASQAIQTLMLSARMSAAR